MQSDSTDRKQRLQQAFNAISGEYDNLRFVQATARRLVELVEFAPGARVLDLGTGTGLAALAAARLVEPGGQVTGIDLSPAMLEQARRKAQALHIANVEFRQGDAERLELPDRAFDAVLCASALFFVPDMPAAVSEVRRVLKPGGLFGFSSFGTEFMQPLTDVWRSALSRYGVQMPGMPHLRLATPEACAELLRVGGFEQVSTHVEELGYSLTFDQRWGEIVAGLEGLPLMQLSDEQRERLRAEYRAELEPLATPKGIYMRLPALFTLGF